MSNSSGIIIPKNVHGQLKAEAERETLLDKELVLSPDGEKITNRPIPSEHNGVPLPPLNVRLLSGLFALRALTDDEIEQINPKLVGKMVFVDGNGKEPTTQPICQILKLPERKVNDAGESLLPGFPTELQDIQVGDIFVAGGGAMPIPTNWGDSHHILMGRPAAIACLLIEGHYSYVKK